MRNLKQPAGQPGLAPVQGLMPGATPGHIIRHAPNGATLGRIAYHGDKPHFSQRDPAKLYRNRPA